MKKLLLLILFFITGIFLFAGDKNISQKPSNLPEGVVWEEGPVGFWVYSWKEGYKIQKPSISWYRGGGLAYLDYETKDGNYEIREKYDENGKLEHIEQSFNYYNYKDVLKKLKVEDFISLNVGKQQLFYKNGKLKEERSYTPVIQEDRTINRVLCGPEVFYDESGKEIKRIDHNVKCEYGYSDIPRKSIDELIAIVQSHNDRKRNENLIKNPVVGKIMSVDQSSKAIEVAYKPGFELSIDDQVCFIVASEIVSFECKENANGTGSFVLKEDKNNKYSSVNKNSEPRFFKKNEVKYTDVLKSGPKPKAGDVKIIAGIEFVYIPAGECPQPIYYDEDANGHVSPFWITRYEVTLGEFLKYSYEANRRLPANKGIKTFNSRYPADLGDYDESARGFCTWFGKKHGVNTTLPLSKEWEFAARGGTSTDFYWGNDSPGDYCWYAGNSGGKYHPVGMKKPNPYGLYDMIGNLWEWCEPSNLRGGAYFSEVRDLKYSVNNYLEVQRHDYYGRYDTIGTGFRMIIRVPE